MEKVHSEGILTDLRDFWWNPDFISLMAARWELKKVKSMLDVGCGAGHWGQMLFPQLSAEATLAGIDPEPVWVEEAINRAQLKGMADRSEYKLGSAENIPYPDNTFDMVTCQTVLVHVTDVQVALEEMMRVLKPGGLLAVSEPNNLASILVFNNINFKNSIDEILNLIKFHLICERGKGSLKQGYNSYGDLIPYHFQNSGLKNIKVYLSDLADYFIPPYNSPREKAIVSSSELPSPQAWVAAKKEHEHYFLAGGGDSQEFDKLWQAVVNKVEIKIHGLKNKTFYTAGGEMLYLISGRK